MTKPLDVVGIKFTLDPLTHKNGARIRFHTSDDATNQWKLLAAIVASLKQKDIQAGIVSDRDNSFIIRDISEGAEKKLTLEKIKEVIESLQYKARDEIAANVKQGINVADFLDSITNQQQSSPAKIEEQEEKPKEITPADIKKIASEVTWAELADMRSGGTIGPKESDSISSSVGKKCSETPRDQWAASIRSSLENLPSTMPKRDSAIAYFSQRISQKLESRLPAQNTR